MTATTSLQSIADRLELTELISRLGRWLDDPASAAPDELIAADATARTPGGSVEGREGVIAQARRNHDGHVTQHLMTDVLVVVDGDEARITSNLLVAFVDPAGPPVPTWQSGSRYAFRARRTPAGWRLTQIEVEPVWQVGERPVPVAA